MEQWLSIDELIALSLPGFPTERSALSRKVNREKWEKRKRETGKRGVTYEYLITSLPTPCHAGSSQSTGLSEPRPSTTPFKGQDSQKALLERMLSSLTEDEAETLNQVLLRKGVEFILLLVDDANQQLLQLSSEEKERVLRLVAQFREGASVTGEEHDLTDPTHQRAGRA